MKKLLPSFTRRFPRLPHLLIAATSLACLPMAEAQIQIGTSTDTNAPDQDLLFTIAPGVTGDNQLSYTNSLRRDVGQTFRNETAMDLRAITLRIAANTAGSVIGSGTPGAAFVINIYRFDGTGNPVPVGVPIYTGEGALPDNLVRSDYLTFDLGEHVRLEAGIQYGLVLGFESAATSQTLSFATTAQAVYPDGSMIYYTDWNTTSGGLEWLSTSRQMEFYAVGDVVIPEPGVAHLSLFLLTGFGAWKLRSSFRSGKLPS